MNDPLVVVDLSRVDADTESKSFTPYRDSIAASTGLSYIELVNRALGKLQPAILNTVTKCIINSAQFDAVSRNQIFNDLTAKKSRSRPSTVLHAQGTSISLALKQHAPNLNDTLKIEYACASGLKSIELVDKIIQDEVYLILAVEVPVADYYEYMLHSLGATASGKYYSPFDRQRRGLALGDGASAVVVTKLGTANKHNLTPVAIVNAIGSFTSAEQSTDPVDTNTLTKFIRSVIDASNVDRTDIVFWDAHATATVKGDQTEYDVFADIFAGIDCKISSFKGRIGHLMSASSLTETVHAIEKLQKGIIPGTDNIVEPMCNDERIITEEVATTGHSFVKCSFGFAGKNACAVLTVNK